MSLVKFLLDITSNAKHWIDDPCLATPTANLLKTKKKNLIGIAKMSRTIQKSYVCQPSTPMKWSQLQNQFFARIKWNV